MNLLNQYLNNIIIKYIVKIKHVYWEIENWNIEEVCLMSKPLLYNTDLYTQRFNCYDLNQNTTKYCYMRFQDNLCHKLQVYISDNNIIYNHMYQSEHFYKKYNDEYIVLSTNTELVTIFDKDLNGYIVNIHSPQIKYNFNVSSDEVKILLKETHDILLARRYLDKLAV